MKNGIPGNLRRRLVVQERRAIRSVCPLEPQDVLQAEYTED
jgi:hypothetical protein